MNGLVIVTLFTVALWLWAFVSMLRLPSWAYQDARTSKSRWAVLLVVALLVPVAGLFICLWFIFSTSTLVRAEVGLDEHVGFPGGPPQY